jgi:hypothetical protein
MARAPGWRRVYDSAERAVAPHADALVRSEEFARATAGLLGVRRELGRRLDRLTARAWHLVNLPAGTDVQRLRAQVGALDREVRRLTVQLDAARAREEG